MNGSGSPKILPARPSTAGDVAANEVMNITTGLTRSNTVCTCSSPTVEDIDVPPVPQLDPETAKTPVLSVTPTKPSLAVVEDPVERSPSPILQADELELKDAYLSGYKNVEDFFHKLLESANFYKRKSSTLEAEVQSLKDTKAKLEERIRILEEESQDWEAKREEREKRKEGRAINKMRKLIWSASAHNKRKTEGSDMPVTTAIEAK